MSYAFTDQVQVEESTEFLDDYYSQYEDDAALEYYSLCCAYGEEF